jgi:hypothetical protein
VGLIRTRRWLREACKTNATAFTCSLVLLGPMQQQKLSRPSRAASACSPFVLWDCVMIPTFCENGWGAVCCPRHDGVHQTRRCGDHTENKTLSESINSCGSPHSEGRTSLPRRASPAMWCSSPLSFSTERFCQGPPSMGDNARTVKLAIQSGI